MKKHNTLFRKLFTPYMNILKKQVHSFHSRGNLFVYDKIKKEKRERGGCTTNFNIVAVAARPPLLAGVVAWPPQPARGGHTIYKKFVKQFL